MTIALAQCLLVLVIERIHRFQSFLDEVSPFCVASELELINLYSALLNAIEDEEIKPSVITLSLDDSDVQNVITMLLIACVELDTLLAATDVFPKLLPRPEAYEFIKELFPANVYEDTTLAIVIWPDYNFGELELRRYLIERIEDTITILGLDQEVDNGTVATRTLEDLPHKPIVLYLAQLEKDNPQMWVPLVHEVGHFIEEDRNILTDVLDGLQPHLDLKADNASQELDLLKNWLPEFISDEISLRVLGPTYYCAFATYSILDPSPLDKPSTHPPPWNRLEMMRQHCALPEAKDTIDYFAELVENRRHWDEVTSGVPPFEFVFTDWDIVYSEVSRHVENLTKDLILVDARTWKTCDDLVTERLSCGIPVGSLVQGESDTLTSMNDNAQMLMQKVYDIPEGEDPLDSDEIQELSKQMEQSINDYKERSCSPGEIVGSGWIEKRRQITEISKDIFKDLKDIPPEEQWTVVDEQIQLWGDLISLTDSLLTISIETTPIMRLFGKK